MEVLNRYFFSVIKNHYFDFNGRASRKEYWLFQLFFIILMILVFTGIICLEKLLFPNDPETLIPLFVLFILASLSPQISIRTRRLHDTNKSAWFLLLSLIPSLGELVLFLFFLMEGDKKENKYGRPTQA